MMNRKKEKESLKQREQRNGYEEDVKNLNDFRAAFVFQKPPLTFMDKGYYEEKKIKEEQLEENKKNKEKGE